MEPHATLALIGGVLAVAYIGSLLFHSSRVPDVLWLLVLGGVLGPWTGLVDVVTAQRFLPLTASLAVVVILFDGALEVTPRLLHSVGARSLALSVGVFGVTTVACGAVAHLLLHLPWPAASLLGMAFGGAGIAIIVPLAKHMDVGPSAMTVVLLEAVTSDILVIMGVFVGATVLLFGASAALLAEAVLLALFVGAAGGLFAGWLWSRWLRVARENAYIMTFAALLLVYAAVEALNGSGPLAVLLFGIVIGNTTHRHGRQSEQPGTLPLVAFHNELAFFIRAFFFVGLGASTDWTLLRDPVFLLTGAALTGTIAVVRLAMAHAVLFRSRLPVWDRTVTGLLFPMGLVTAAVSVVPHEMGVPDTEHFPDIAAVVILLTNMLATYVLFFAGWFHARGGGRTPEPAASA